MACSFLPSTFSESWYFFLSSFFGSADTTHDHSAAQAMRINFYPNCRTLFTSSGTMAAHGFLTKQIDARRVGVLMNALGLLQSLSGVVTPIVIILAYAWTVKAFSSMVFSGIQDFSCEKFQ